MGKILITGATGNLGSRTLELLLKKFRQIRSLYWSVIRNLKK